MSSKNLKNCFKNDLFSFLIIGILMGSQLYGSEPNKFGEFPPDKILITEEAVRLDPNLGDLKWLDIEKIEKSVVKVKDINLISLIAIENLQWIVKKECIPLDLLEKFMPLRHYYKGNDASLARYKYENYLVQIIVTSGNIRIVIGEEKPSERIDKKSKLDFANEVIKKFFNESGYLVKSQLVSAARGSSIEGKNEKAFHERQHWYETVEWWTNGKIVCFRICNSPSSSAGCSDYTDWFAMVISYEKGLRKAKEDLTQEMIDKVLELKKEK